MDTDRFKELKKQMYLLGVGGTTTDIMFEKLQEKFPELTREIFEKALAEIMARV